MRITVLLFGGEARLLGRGSVPLDLRVPVTCTDILGTLAEQWPALRPALRASRLAVNHAFAAPEHPVGPGDEVALIGPVGGG